MLEVLSQDYIRTAQAKGLAQGKVLIGHALKNAAVPIVTVIGIGVALLIGGVIVTETVFAIPGIGRLTVDAILRRDYPIIQGVILLFSRRLRAHQSRWSTSATRCSTRACGIEHDARSRSTIAAVPSGRRRVGFGRGCPAPSDGRSSAAADPARDGR